VLSSFAFVGVVIVFVVALLLVFLLFVGVATVLVLWWHHCFCGAVIIFVLSSFL